VIFSVAPVTVALSSTTFGEQIRRADILADLLEAGAVTAIYLGDDFRGIVDRTDWRRLPMLAPGRA
jgi:hypothetical protein